MKPHCLALALLLALPIFAAEYTIKSGVELRELGRRLQPGDSVLMADGAWHDEMVVLTARGSAQKPIVLRATTAGKTIFTGKSKLVLDGEWLVLSGVLIHEGGGELEGIVLRGAHNRLTDSAMVGGTYKHFVRVFGSHQRVDHCALLGKTSEEPTLQIEAEATAPNEDQIERNYFGPRPPLGKNGGETIRIGYSGQSMNISRAVVQENLFEQCDGEIEIISNKSCENVYRANTFLECAGMLTLRHGNRCVVDGNFFLGHHKKHSGGVRVIGEDHVIINNYIDGVDRGAFWVTCGVPDSKLNQYFVAQRCLIAFNTVVDSAGPCVDLSNGLGSSGRTLKPTGVVVANNLFAPGKNGEVMTGEEGTGWQWRGNLVSGGTAYEHTGFRSGDAKLQQAADGLRRPSDGSLVRGAAEGEFPQVSADIDGQLRTSPKDVGCDQISSAPVTRRPLARADVGPSWFKMSGVGSP